MSNNTGAYVALTLVGGAMISLIFAGLYYTSGNANIGSPTGMSSYSNDYTQYGGKKTRKHRRRHLKKSIRR